MKSDQQKLVVELAAMDECIHEFESLQLRYEAAIEEYRATLLENSVFLSKRREYNFDMTIKFDQILREFVTSLYLEEHQNKAVQSHKIR